MSYCSKYTAPKGEEIVQPYRMANCRIADKGLLDLAYRSGEIDIIQAHVVYANDTFECQYGLNADLKHIPAESDRGEPVKVYAMFRTKSGGYGFEVMTMEDIRKHAEKYSKSYNSSYSPWKTSFEEMALKTVLKRVLKYAPLKSEFVKGVVQDETIKTTISEDMYSEPNEFIVDAETGEVSEEPAEQTE